MAADPSWIESVYQIKLRELREIERSEFETFLGEMRSPSHRGADMALLRKSGGKLADDAVARCEAAIPALAEAHARAGERDVAGIVENIQTKFVEPLLAVLPGASLYVSGRGRHRFAAEGLRLRQAEEARFLARKAALARAVVHYVVRAVGGTSPVPAAPRTNKDPRTLAAESLAVLYVATTNHSIRGRALRHSVRDVVTGLDARRALANSLVPELAERSGSGDEDYFRPTLACLVHSLPEAVAVVGATLSMLRSKYDREGDFDQFTWEELQSHCQVHSLSLPLDRESTIQVLSAANLSSGWYRTHWGAPHDLEALVEVGDAHALIGRSSATDEPAPQVHAPTEGTTRVKGTPLGPFDIALSFPGSERDRVEPIAQILDQQLGGKRVFYDKFFKAQLARPNLDVILQEIYRHRSRLLVVFVGQGYQDRDWCGVEWRAIRDIMKSRQDEQVMLVRTDDARVDGIFSIDGYIDLRETSSSELADLILERLANSKD